jgi:putative two-component system response regulator
MRPGSVPRLRREDADGPRPTPLAELLATNAAGVLASMLESIHDGVVVTDAASRIQWANPAYCGMTGFSLAQLVGRTPALLRPTHVDPDRSAEIWDVLDRTGQFCGRLENRRADGTTFDADIAICQLPGTDDGPDLYLCTMKDVSADVALARHVALETKRAEQARDTTILALASLAEQRDPEAGAHLARIEEYVTTMTTWVVAHHPSQLPLYARDPKSVGRCARLHDIGKVGVPDAVLLKQGPLDAHEQVQMRRHPRLGAEILDRVLQHQPESSFLRIARDIVAFHHEAFDGSGYPYGLARGEIPLVAQLTTVADVLDALTSRRPYKPAHRFEDAVRWIVERSGTLFEPLAVEALLASLETATEIHRALGDAPSDMAIRPSGIELQRPARRSSRPPLDRSPTVATALAEAIACEGGGEVVVRCGNEVGRVYVWGGRVAWAYLTGDRRVLTQSLIEDHGLTAHDLREVLEDCKRSGRNFGETLVEWGLMSRERFHEALRRHVADRLRAVLALPDSLAMFVPQARAYDGSFTFTLDELLEAQP